MSEQMPDSGAPRTESVAQQVGEMLRATREGRGESVTEAALALKLTQRQVEAMESGRFDLLPGAAFARGFLRNYARHLGVDPAAVMAAIEQPAAGAGSAVELAPVSNAEGVMPAGGEGGRRTIVPAATIVVGLVLVMLAGWYFDWFEPAPAPVAPVEVAPPAPEITEGTPEAEEQVPVAPLLPPIGEAPAPAPEAVAPAAPGPEEAAPTPAAPTPATPETTPQAGPQQSAGPQGAAPAAPAAASGNGTAEAAGEPAGGLQFHFDGEAWVEVRDARGRVLHSGINPPGSTRTVLGEPPFALVVGNAGQVEVRYEGNPVDLAPHIRSNVARLTIK